MSDNSETKKQRLTRTGAFRRPEGKEPEARREPPKPSTLPEHMPNEKGGTTGVHPIIPEGEDSSADLDDDPVTGQ